MLDTAEADELRALQARAYGRGGGLTDAEAERLRELEGARGLAAVVAAVPATAEAWRVREENAPSGGGIETEAPPEQVNSAEATEPAEALVGQLDRPGRPETDPAYVNGTLHRTLRRHWRLAATASALLLAIGVGAGWMLFGRGGMPVVVPAWQQEALAMLEKSPFDDGSVKFVGEKHGVGVWQATKGDGVRECIVLTHGDEQSSECRPEDEVLTTDGFIELSAGIDLEEDGETVTVWATTMPDISGEQVTVIQRVMVYIGDWRDQYSDEEIIAVEHLEAEGFDPWELYLVGYDGDLPIWHGHLEGANCIAAVVESEVVRSCGDTGSVGEHLELRIGETLYEIVQTTNRGPVLTIVREASGTGGTGEPLELGGEHGDPIEVSPESPSD